MDYTLTYLERPGRTMRDGELDALVAEMRAVAATCFDEIPSYQALTGKREELEHCVISIARRDDGTMAAFCSGILLHVEGVQHVLHMGLSCVHIDDRGAGLARKVNDHMARTYLLTKVAPFGKMWITSCACVLSSLGNVALYFDELYPSPLYEGEPSDVHRRIARVVDARYREQIYIEPDAVFDDRDFVFRGSVKDTVFEKTAEDERFRHRVPELNEWYRGIMHFENGDEVLQVGYATLWSGVKSVLGVARLREAKLKKTVQLSPATASK